MQRRKTKSPKRSKSPKRKTAAVKSTSTTVQPGQLLCSRRQSALMLGGVSTATIIRLENKGRLTVVKPNGTPGSQAFNRVSEVRALAGEGVGK